MMLTNRTFAPIEVLVDELVRCGLTDAVASPGSRNAPILLALAGRAPEVRCHSVIDERSAGFVAIGMAKASGRPVVVTCTSGTAVANLLPAVVEASEARVPLIVLTGDRPPELREVGAGQSIDQVKIFGSAVRWFVEVGTHEPSRATAVHHRALGCRAWATAAGGRPGPVHLNLSLREPLAPVHEALDERDWAGRPDGRPWVRVAASAAPRVADEEVLSALVAGRRGAVVCGPTRERDLAPAVAEMAARLGWPVLAEPGSGVRCGPHDRANVVAHYDALLRAGEWEKAHRADVVLRIGDTPTSKPLRAWLGAAGRQIVVDPDGVWHEPTRAADLMLTAPAAGLCRVVADALPERGAGTDPGWLEGWLAADAVVPPALAALPPGSEPRLCAALAEALPDGALLWTSSSMPIREVESFVASLPTGLRFFANRGANGIDGVVSAALGAALVHAGPTVLLIGDVALVHDLGGLAGARRLGAELVIVCLNNGGGGIFDFLPVAGAAEPEAYERLVATPPGLDLGAVAAALGLAHRVLADPADLPATLRSPGLVEVVTDRATNVAAHRRVFNEVERALSRGL